MRLLFFFQSLLFVLPLFHQILKWEVGTDTQVCKARILKDKFAHVTMLIVIGQQFVVVEASSSCCICLHFETLPKLNVFPGCNQILIAIIHLCCNEELNTCFKSTTREGIQSFD